MTAERGKREKLTRKERKVINVLCLMLICIVSEVMTGSRDLGQQCKMKTERSERGMRRSNKETRVEENVVMQEKGGETN